MTYKEAYNKIIDAYFKDEIKVEDPKFCFCGTLCNNRISWTNISRSFSQRFHSYSLKEYGLMEKALFSAWPEVTWYGNGELDSPYDSYMVETPDYEEKLFAGMCAALEVLKEIHRSRGENVDEVPEFTQRVKTWI